ncbi:MAG: hypothetical protein KKF33_02015, partial [Alphaproteobacteria bacterium]|nr:hypothetical protein [Alphaproteobacteria bacterium]
AIELVTDLEQFNEISVRYGGGGETSAVDSPTSDFVLTGIVRPDGDLVQYSAILTDVNSGLVVWNHTIGETMEEIAKPGVLDDVSRKLSLLLGSAHGPLHQRVRTLLTSRDALELDASDYLCLMRFHQYRDTGTTDDAARVDDCLTALGKQQEPNASFLAMQASLLVDRMGSGNGERFSNPVELTKAETKLDAAVSLDPTNAFVWEQYARLRAAAGDQIRARAAYSSAVQLNPANADALASYALHLALSGDLIEAQPMAADAVSSAEDPPAWYFGAPTLLSLRRGELEEAGRYAEIYAQADRELGPILAIMAGQRNHDGTMVNRYVAQVLDVPSFRVRGVLPRLRERVTDPGLVEQIRIALLAAGVPQTTLAGNF